MNNNIKVHLQYCELILVLLQRYVKQRYKQFYEFKLVIFFTRLKFQLSLSFNLPQRKQKYSQSFLLNNFYPFLINLLWIQTGFLTNVIAYSTCKNIMNRNIYFPHLIILQIILAWIFNDESDMIFLLFLWSGQNFHLWNHKVNISHIIALHSNLLIWNCEVNLET